MNGFGAGLRRAVADDRAYADQRGLGALHLGRFNGPVQLVQIVAVGDELHVPIVGLEALCDIFGVAEVGGAVERDEVVVVEDDQLAELQRAGQRGSLVRDAFHQVAVAAKHVGVVVHDLVVIVVVDRGEMLFSHRETDRLSEALAQWSGGDLDAGGFAVLGVAGRVRAPLAELLELVQREVIARKVQHAIEQRRGVAVGQDEAVAIRPQRVGRVVLHELVVEQVGNGSASERRSGVAALGRFHLVHGEKAQCVDRQLIELVLLHCAGLFFLLLCDHLCPRKRLIGRVPTHCRSHI